MLAFLPLILTPIHAADTIELGNLNEEFFTGHLNKIIENITQESSFYDLISFSIGMVVYGIFIFHFYRFLAKRNVLSYDIETRLRGGKLKSSGEKISAAPRIVAYIATKIFIFPIIVFLWFLAYSLFMFFLAQDLSIKTVFLVSSSLVIAIRIAAYYNEDLARDIAKLLPFTLLGIFLLSPTFFDVDEIKSRLAEVPNFLVQIVAFILVAIIVETTLSILYIIKLKFFGHKEKKNNLSASEQPV